jgi:hypothetical protein
MKGYSFDKFMYFILKVLRRLWSILFKTKNSQPELRINDPDEVAELISMHLELNKPCMIARFGSTEMLCLTNYLGVKTGIGIFGFISGKRKAWWWEEKTIKQMHDWSGFFPQRIDYVEKFSELMINDIPEVDILASWLDDEKHFSEDLAHAVRIHFEFLNPYFSEKPWTLSLEGKKVLVIHPFAELIKSQYVKRNLIFERNILPEFELSTIKAVQSIAGQNSPFDTWFDALESMKKSINSVDYDVALIGAGAYGFPLAAHVKRSGKKAVHMGGALQLLFGIRGRRWEDPNYGVKEWGLPYGAFSNLMNDYWVRPGSENRPKNAEIVEGACYW